MQVDISVSEPYEQYFYSFFNTLPGDHAFRKALERALEQMTAQLREKLQSRMKS
jgi:hypothetical protein